MFHYLPRSIHHQYESIQTRALSIAVRQHKAAGIGHRIRLFLWVVTALTPALVAVGLLQVTFHVSVNQLVPMWSDELLYWHQARSFSAAGFNSGYYTVLEIPAAMGWSHFYSWGAFVPVLYGTLGHVFGWNLASMSILNLAFITLGTAFFVYTTRPTIGQSLLLLVVLATFNPFILYSSSSLLSLLAQTCALIIAAGFYRLIRWRSRSPYAYIGIAALVRPTWAILFIPLWTLLSTRRLKFRRVLLILFAGFWGLLFFYLIQALSGAPFPNFRNELLQTASDDLTGAIEMLWGNIQTNISLINQGNLLEIWQRRQIGLLIVLLIVGGVIIWRRHPRTPDSRQQLAVVGLSLFALTGMIVLLVMFYDVKEWRDYRALAPFILMILVLLVAFRIRWIVVIMAAAMLFTLPETLHVYTIWTDWHVSAANSNAYYAWKAELAKVMTYDSAQTDPWCNTVLHSSYYLFADTSVLLAVDEGLGLSSPVFEEDYDLPFRSRYLLLDDTFYQDIQDGLNVQTLLTVPGGKLYLNLDSDCPE